MNFAIRYLTEYDYDADIVDNLNALRVSRAPNGRQRCDEFSVRLDAGGPPAPPQRLLRDRGRRVRGLAARTGS